MTLLVGRVPLLLASSLLFCVGCGGATSNQPATTPMDSVVSLHLMEMITTGRPPANEQQFKEFIAAKGAAALQRAGVADAEALLTASRDGQRLVVVYGDPPRGMAPNVIAFERQGVDGKRLVGYNSGLVREVDEATFREQVPKDVEEKLIASK